MLFNFTAITIFDNICKYSLYFSHFFFLKTRILQISKRGDSRNMNNFTNSLIGIWVPHESCFCGNWNESVVKQFVGLFLFVTLLFIKDNKHIYNVKQNYTF